MEEHYTTVDEFKELAVETGLHISAKIIILGVIVILISSLCFILFSKKAKKFRKHFKFYWNWLIYRLGFRTYISRRYVGRCHVHENNEPLIEFIPNEKIIVDEKTVEYPLMLRRKVIIKLEKIAQNLPDGVYLKLNSAFKSKKQQDIAWQEAMNEMMKLHPGVGRNEIIQLAHFKAKDPKLGLGGHETGGAVDVCLCDKDGIDFDYGTKFHEHNDYTATRNVHLTTEQKRNRNRLVKIMKKEGFVNFPGEWWHFSYGDRMWAAYKGKRNGAKYGSVEKGFDGNYVFAIPTKKINLEN